MYLLGEVQECIIIGNANPIEGVTKFSNQYWQIQIQRFDVS